MKRRFLWRETANTSQYNLIINWEQIMWSLEKRQNFIFLKPRRKAELNGLQFLSWIYWGWRVTTKISVQLQTLFKKIQTICNHSQNSTQHITKWAEKHVLILHMLQKRYIFHFIYRHSVVFEWVTISFSKRFRVEHCNTLHWDEGLNPFLALSTSKVPLISK